MKKNTVIAVLISAIFLYIALKDVSFYELFESLKRFDYIYLIPAFLLTLFTFIIRSVRWHYLLKPIKKAKFKNLVSSTIIGFMTNSLFPARLGELVRANILGNDENVKKSSVFATIVIERLFDAVSILFILFITVLAADLTVKLSPAAADNLKQASLGMLFLCIAISVFIVIMTKRFEKSKDLVLKLLKPFPKKMSDYIGNLMESFKEGLKLEKSFKNFFIITVYSFLHWIFCAFPIYIVLKGFGYDLPLVASFVVLIMKVFAVMAPTGAGYIAAMLVTVMYGAELYNIPKKPDGLSFAMIIWLVDFLPLIASGFIMLWFKDISLKSIEEPEEIEEA